MDPVAAAIVISPLTKFPDEEEEEFDENGNPIEPINESDTESGTDIENTDVE